VTEVNVRDIIERLRDATSAAGETITEVPPLRLPDPRPRPWLTPLAAAAAVVLAIAGGVAVYRAGFGEHAAPAHGVAALPRFFAHVAGTDVVVRSSDSGREVGRLAAPSGREWYAHVAAAGDNRTFYAATEARDCRPRLYRFTVGEGGRVTAPQALPYGPPPGVMVTSLAVSGDGSTLAYGLQSCDPAAAAGRITVADTATGRTREWRGDRLVTGLSLSEDGRYLAFREAGLLVVVKDGTPRTVVPAPADDPPPQVDADPDPAETDVTSRPDPAAEDPALPVDADPAPAEAEPSPQATPGKPTPSASPERSSEKSPGKSSETSPKPSARATASPAPSGAPSPVRPGETETVPEPTPTASVVRPEAPITPDPTDPPVRDSYAGGADGLPYPASPAPEPAVTAVAGDVRFVRVPDGRARVLDTTTEPGDLSRSRAITLTGSWGDVVCGVVISPDGRRLYAGVGFRREAATAGVAEFDAATGEPVRHLARGEQGLLCLVDGDGGGTHFLVRRGAEYGVVAGSGGYRTLAAVGDEPRSAAAW
jgi:hypothetical protein